MQNAAATMRAAQGGASPTQSAAAGTDATKQAAAAQAQKQTNQNAAGSAIGAGYAKAATAPASSTAAMPGSQVAAAKPASSVAPVVKTASGGTLTTSDGKPVTSRSADEIANTGAFGIQKPSAADRAAGQKTLDSIKNFFGGGKKAAAPAANNQSSGYTAQAQAQKTPTVAEEETNEHLESARPIEEELANGADDRATQDIDFMTRVISGGLNKEKVQHKNGYQFADNPLAMKESKVYSANDLLHDYRKLSGLE
jgi:hypothetical protein